MNSLLSKSRRRRAGGDNGFTLIELLVVVVILGVLIAIAVPLYLNYRKGANDAATQSDLRNTISVLELCNANNGSYPIADFVVGESNPAEKVAQKCEGKPFNLSSGTAMKYYIVDSGASFVIVGTNSSGAGKFYCYNSSVGGSIKTLAATVTSPASTSKASC